MGSNGDGPDSDGTEFIHEKAKQNMGMRREGGVPQNIRLGQSGQHRKKVLVQKTREQLSERALMKSTLSLNMVKKKM